MDAPQLTVVVPVYNEAARLEASLRRLLAFVGDQAFHTELVCVDDGSTDGSGAVLRRFASADDRVRVVSLPQNRGKGAAVRRGMLAVRGRIAVFMDADLSTGLDALAPALAAVREGADVVLGSRRVPGARIVGRQARWRDLLGRAFSTLAGLLVDRAVPDFTCGFKAFSAEAAGAVFSRARIDGWAFDAELVAIARALDLRVTTVAVEWHDEPGSKVRFPGALVSSLIDLVRIGRWKRNGRFARQSGG